MTQDTDSKDAALQEIGRSAHAALAGMVAALQCDYERLDELRMMRDDSSFPPRALAQNPDHSLGWWEDQCPDDAAELAELESDAGECESEDDARQRIQDDPLSIEYRSDWCSDPREFTPAEFCVLLSTGGPAVRIIGELSGRVGYSGVRLQVQDWFTPWTDYRGADVGMLEAYLDCLGVAEMADCFGGR